MSGVPADNLPLPFSGEAPLGKALCFFALDIMTRGWNVYKNKGLTK
jgi:hypothetical protein